MSRVQEGLGGFCFSRRTLSEQNAARPSQQAPKPQELARKVAGQERLDLRDCCDGMVAVYSFYCAV